MFLKFPEKFYWGSASSSHQVEGNNHNDWSEWEKKNANRLSQIAHLPDYILNNYPNPLQKENYISGPACGHYNKFKEDFDIAKSLGQNAHRFSIEWSRVEPEEGKFNEKEIEHYRQVIIALKERGIEPFVTLWHWTNPIWLKNKNGWQSKKIVFYFRRYVEKIVGSFANEIKFWIMLNEPEIFAANSYLRGKWPPQEKSLISYFKTTQNLIAAHKSPYKIIKKINPQAQIGIAKNNVYFEPHKNNPVNLTLKKFIDWWWNFYFL